MGECSINNCTEYSLVYKMVVLGMWGFFVKMYDDLDDLYLFNNQRIMMVLQTLQTIIMSYWLFVVASTKFDHWIVIVFLGIFVLDWEAYTGNAYFFSATFGFLILSIGILIVNRCFFTMKELLWFFALLFLAMPWTEVICIKVNGIAADIGKYFHLFPPNNDKLTFIQLSETDLEVSFHKLKTRITSLFYMSTALCILFYLKSYSKNDRMWVHLLSALIVLNTCHLAYTTCSIFNQANVLYFHPEIIELHKEKNQD